MNDFKENYIPLTVVASEPLNGKMELIYKIICDFGINAKKSIQIFNFDGNNHWFTENLIASISKMDKHKVEAYFNPCEVVGKLYKDSLDIKKLDYAVKLLQEHDIIMVDFDKQIISKDYLDYLIDYHQDVNRKPRDIYIINTLDALLKKTTYSKEMVLEKLSNFAKKNQVQIIVIADAKYRNSQNLELNDIIEYETICKYTTKYLLSKRETKNTLAVLEYNAENDITSIKRYKVNFDSHYIKEEI